jgi:hypothetical protein
MVAELGLGASLSLEAMGSGGALPLGGIIMST